MTYCRIFGNKGVIFMDLGLFTRKSLQQSEGHKIAIQMESGEKWSYQELHEKSNQYANMLKSLGVKKGDSVGLLLYNCLDYFALYFGIAKIGAIAVRINFRLTPSELSYILTDSKTKILFIHDELLPNIATIYNELSIEEYIVYGQKPDVPWATSIESFDSVSTADIQGVSIQLQDPVMLMYTSGTTGRPKGALWTHNTTFWFSTIQMMKWGYTGKEIGMTTGPLYHVGAMEDIALPILLAGGTVIITKSKGFEIDRVLQVIEREQVTDIFLFPFMIYDLLNSSMLDDATLEKLTRIYTGGDPLMPWAIERMKEKFPHVGIIQVYGLTEGQPIACCLDSEDALRKSASVGKPLPLTEIEIMDDEGHPLAVGEVGEIWVRSPGVSEGYWEKPEETASTFWCGWCKTGDLGMKDEEGYITVAGRKKDMIRSGGENVYAAEIEDIIYRHPSVLTVSVIAIPDPKYLEAVCAVIIPKEGHEVSEEDIIAFTKQYLAKYKVPKKVVFVDEIPRTPSGKVKKVELREKYRYLGEAKGDVVI